jgi:hypothetical protein
MGGSPTSMTGIPVILEGERVELQCVNKQGEALCRVEPWQQGITLANL